MVVSEKHLNSGLHGDSECTAQYSWWLNVHGNFYDRSSVIWYNPWYLSIHCQAVKKSSVIRFIPWYQYRLSKIIRYTIQFEISVKDVTDYDIKNKIEYVISIKTGTNYHDFSIIIQSVMFILDVKDCKHNTFCKIDPIHSDVYFYGISNLND